MGKDLIIGVLGGMGTYATINLFRQYAEVFEAEKEWGRPRIIIDNRCTMPSRVRAFLYKENVEQLVAQMTDSISRLIDAGQDNDVKILLACNTSHLFLPAIYEKLPEAEAHITNIISSCVDELVQDKIEEVHLLASEGTIESAIYQECLTERGITCTVPQKTEYAALRDCIEAVKQNKYSPEIEETFHRLLDGYSAVILGCTELPILYEKYSLCSDVKVYDPLLITLKKIKREYSDD